MVFFTARGPLTAGGLRTEAESLANEIPAGGYVVNRRTDQIGFTVGLLAAAMRGARTILTSDPSPATQARVAALFPAAVALTDSAICRASGDGARDLGSVDIVADACAAIVFTSGTTGQPIPHEKTWGGLAMRSEAAARRLGFSDRQPVSLVATVPPQHMYGFETSILLPLHAPCASWAGPTFFPADVAIALNAVPSPRLLVTTPLQMRALLDSGIPMPPLRMVISATAPLPIALAAEAERRWATRVIEIFGATEVGSIATRRTTDGETWTLYSGIRLSADGRVRAPGAVTARIADVIDPVTPRRFHLLGRASDIVKRGGRRASLAALNAALAGIAGVHDGAFYMPAETEGAAARPVVVVVAPGLREDDIMARLRAAIDPIFLPRRIVLVERLPRTTIGKLRASDLASLAGAGP